MIYPAIVTLIALVVYLVITIKVSKARVRTGVKLPAISGNAEFERYYRVQMNTLEQMMLFLPALWLCAVYFKPVVATALGTGWIIGRILFAAGYYKEVGKRMPGFIIAMLCTVGLMLCTAYGIGMHLMINYLF